MVRIPNIKIPSVRVGSIGPTWNIGTGGATPAPPTPITYLTQWKIVGNSEVHGVGNLTSWKVEGNSVVDNNAILSCGDLGQDGKYHVKISNGVDVYDIALNEPLRKVNGVADSIEFTNGVATLTRNLAKSADLGSKNWMAAKVGNGDDYYMAISATALNPNIKIVGTAEATALCSLYNTVAAYETYTGVKEGIGISSSLIRIYDKNYNQQSSVTAFKQHIKDIELIYWIEPITEVIEVSPFPVSSTDTYTSANVVSYSAFEHTEHKEIWSCGEYNAIDGKYHILVQPQGGSIADIALTEPLRMVDNVADTIEFPSGTDGKALVTRNISSYIITQSSTLSWVNTNTASTKRMSLNDLTGLTLTPSVGKTNVMCPLYTSLSGDGAYNNNGISISAANNGITIRDANYDCLTNESKNAFKAHVMGMKILYVAVTPTTELVDAPQIAEAESYSMVISQGAKAIGWSSFETDSE